ncbi:hypothetical protein L210DRAFT_3541889 [Boletus edulis BED1]|uniref:Uncharacterized protein n=1 Tax=Boletus edulis BED1 TaxID=1328754 RepID=A0AAD4BU48_BOLED|nr:hypothetical protein L210DRAFT_3541889 [Boletus edulis BED1]
MSCVFLLGALREYYCLASTCCSASLMRIRSRRGVQGRESPPILPRPHPCATLECTGDFLTVHAVFYPCPLLTIVSWCTATHWSVCPTSRCRSPQAQVRLQAWVQEARDFSAKHGSPDNRALRVRRKEILVKRIHRSRGWHPGRKGEGRHLGTLISLKHCAELPEYESLCAERSRLSGIPYRSGSHEEMTVGGISPSRGYYHNCTMCVSETCRWHEIPQ